MATAISIVNGEYRINAGSWTSAGGSISNGDTVTVRRTSSASYEDTVSLTLTVGTYSTDFDITTRPELFEVTTTYGLSGDNSGDSCTIGTETETLYTKNPSGIVDVGDWFYKDNGSGGYEVYVQGTFPIGTDPNYYWISYLEGATQVWAKLAYDSGVWPDSGDLIMEKSTCAPPPENLITIGGTYVNPTLDWHLTASSDDPVTSDVTVTLEMYGSVSSETNFIDVTILSGDSIGINTGGWTNPFNPSDTLTVQSIVCSPEYDMNFTYTATT